MYIIRDIEKAKKELDREKVGVRGSTQNIEVLSDSIIILINKVQELEEKINKLEELR